MAYTKRRQRRSKGRSRKHKRSSRRPAFARQHHGGVGLLII
jgi:hypothetical protein